MRTDVLVVGAGPAGLAATVTARELGARVTLVDESYRLGGQYLRRRLTETAPPPAQSAPVVTPDQIEACTDEAQLREWWKASGDATKALITERVQILRHEAEAPHEL